jgi:hypothetical protein
MVSTQEDALQERLKKTKQKQSKAERLAGVVARAEKPVEKKTAEIRKAHTGDKKDDGSKPKTKKKISATVTKWRALPKEIPDAKAKIKIIRTDKNPKRGKAADRFTLYKDGMSAAEYIELSHSKGNPKAMAREDIRWDLASGFIELK